MRAQRRDTADRGFSITQWLRKRMDSTPKRSTLQTLSLRVSDECPPGRTIGTRFGSKVFGKHAPQTFLSISMPKAAAICWAMRTQPNFVLRCFISTMAAKSCAEGLSSQAFVFGMKRRTADYFRWTNTLWNLNSVVSLRLADSIGMRCGLTKRCSARARELRRTLC
jgi:hypothetical protein